VGTIRSAWFGEYLFGELIEIGLLTVLSPPFNIKKTISKVKVHFSFVFVFFFFLIEIVFFLISKGREGRPLSTNSHLFVLR
jgi:hypothetical protein